MTWLLAGVEELLPVVLFFVVQLYHPFSTAVTLMVVSTVLLVGFAWWWGTGVPKFAVFSTLFLLLFAVPSVVLDDPRYFMVSDTILDGGFALMLLGSLWLKKTVLQYFFERIFALPDSAWRTLTWRWGILFLVLAVLNEFVRLNFDTATWSTFKLAATIFMLLFGLWQFRLSTRERIEGESNRLGLRI
jgi:intracellular septation protein